MKVTAQEVKEMLEKEQYTKSELADIFKVCGETIKNKLRQLRNDGEPIIHNENGFLLLTKEGLTDEEISEAFRVWIEWLMSVVKGMMICAKPVRPLLPALRKELRDKMSLDERKHLAESCVKIKGLLDYVETEEEDES